MNVIFDLGNVLIRWDLYAGYDDLFDSPEALRRYLDMIGFEDWNRRQDGGRSWADGVTDLETRLGSQAWPATEYPARHARTIATPVPGSWALLDRLAARDVPLYALTNWSAELFPHALATYPGLSLFRDILVSGIEGMLKPEPAIYQRLLTRNGLRADESLFIDDSAENVAGARAIGMDAVLFTDAATLERDLVQRGLL